MKALVYDLEIKKAILSRNQQAQFGIEYCKGWRDYAGMGISCLCAYDFEERRYRVFDDSNIMEFFYDYSDYLKVSFNGVAFDNPVIAATWAGLSEQASLESLNKNSYDILASMWEGDGLSRTFGGGHGGYKLDDTAFQNLNTRKSGNGADAPIWYQQGQLGKVIDYCLEDVRITARLFTLIVNGGELRSPKNPSTFISMPPIPSAYLQSEPLPMP